MGLLRRILEAAEERFVPADARTRRAILRPAIEGLTLEACQAAFEEAWSSGQLSLTTAGNLDLGPDGAEQLAAAYDASAAVAVEAPAAVATAAFAYASDPELAGAIAERAEVEDLGFSMLRFENGVALNVKRTDFREQQIPVSAPLGAAARPAPRRHRGPQRIHQQLHHRRRRLRLGC